MDRMVQIKSITFQTAQKAKFKFMFLTIGTH